jgi:hypothetical protein
MSFRFLPLTFLVSFEIVIDRFLIISFVFGVITFFSFFRMFVLILKHNIDARNIEMSLLKKPT